MQLEMIVSTMDGVFDTKGRLLRSNSTSPWLRTGTKDIEVFDVITFVARGSLSPRARDDCSSSEDN